MSGEAKSRLEALSPKRRELVEALLRQRKKTQAPDSRPERVARKPGDPLPLSAAQRRWWLLHRLAKEAAIDNTYLGVRLSGPLDVAALGRTLHRVAERHESMRAVFVEKDGEPVHHLLARGSIPLSVVDLLPIPISQRRRQLDELARQEVQRPFDLARGPVARALLVREEEEAYSLVLTLHHIVSDRWSIDILLFEVAHFYDSTVRRQPVELPPLPIQYSDFARWQNQRIESGFFGPQLEYWRGKLADPPEPLRLPGSGPSSKSGKGRRVDIALPPELVGGLSRLGQEMGATLFMVLLGGFKILLHRLTESLDLAVGSPIVHRSAPRTEGLIGCFVNTLVLRTDWREDRSGSEALAAVRQGCLDAYAHQDLPFETLVEELRPSRDRGSSPFFQVLFALNDSHDPSGGRGRLGSVLQRHGLALEPIEIDSGATQADLVLHVERSGEGARCLLDFRRDSFETTAMQRLLRGYRQVLESLVEEPETRVSQLAWLTRSEIHQVLVEWNDLERAYAREPSVAEVFSETAELHRDSVALVEGQIHLSYGCLAERAGSLARRLESHGVGGEAPVALALHRSVDLVIAMLAVLKAGGAYVPMDPEYPPERRELMIRDCGAVAEVTSQEGLVCSRLAEGEARTGRPSGRSLAYIMYTSGSTGRPKGTEIPHRGILRLVLSADYSDLGPEEIHYFLASPSFDAATFEIWGALLNGGRLVVGPREQQSLAELGQQLRRERVTQLFLTTALFNLMVEDQLEALAGLRFLLTGGEAHSLEHFRRARERLTSTRVVHVYGPTESTTFSNHHPVVPSDLQGDGIPIGGAIANTRAWVADTFGHPVGIGGEGELMLGGDGLARGYLGRRDLTAERFVPDPTGGGRGERAYRTGDRVRWLPDGEILFVGRGDRQIKLRGFRVELGEIESVLREHPEVRHAAVEARREGAESHHILAWVDSAESTALDGIGLRAYLQERLPDFMIPSRLLVCDELPLNANGKIDRRALPEPEEDLGPSSEVRRLRTPMEELVAGLWEEAFQQQGIGLDDDFFDLGGHSLLATRLVAAIEKALGARISLQDFFTGPTIAEVARALEQTERRAGESDLQLVVTEPGTAGEPFPLTEVQEAYWLGRLEVFDLGGTSAQAYLEVEFESLDLDTLQRVARRLIDRHPMLRAVIDTSGEQRVLQEVPAYTLGRVDLRALGPEALERASHQIREASSRRLLVADRFPLFDLRASLRPGGAVRLHILTDALIADAWSWQILAQEADLLYHDEKASMPPLGITFRDYVLAEKRLAETARFQESLAYWRDRCLELAPAPELPVVATRQGEVRFERRSGRLEPELWNRLKALGLQRGITSSAVVLSLFAEALAIWSKTPRFTLNLTLFNRLPFHPDIHRVVGDFTSLTLLEVERSPDATFETFLRSVQDRLWRDLDHRFVGGIRVIRELAALRGPEMTTMPVVFTSLLNLDPGAGRAQPRGLQGKAVFSITQTPQVWLDHQVHEEAGALVYTWDSVAGLFPPRMLDDLFASFEGRLRQLADDEAAWVEPVSRRIPGEQASLFRRVNTWSEPAPKELLHRLGMSHLQARPTAPAVLTSDRSLEMAELFARARSLAEKLEEGAGSRGRVVAIAMEKGWEQVVAALAVLEAGGAYLPIDVHLPEARIHYLLADGEVETVLTQARVASRIRWPEGLRILEVETVPPAAGPPQGAPVSEVTDLAYIIYTSGSTGQPKGVRIDHRGAVNTILDINRRYRLGASDRILGVSSLSFDLSVWDLFGSLAAGAALVLPYKQDPAHWLELMELKEVTVWNSAPPLMVLLVEHLEAAGAHLPASLRLVLLSGDWIPVSLPGRLRALHGGNLEIISLGGATEASIWSIAYPIDEVDPGWVSIPYGKPLTGQTFHVLDDSLEPRPVWVPGELFIGGVGVALGYHGDAEKTAERFLRHPGTGERLYRTGDLGRYLPDGNIEFLGREDFQVKIQGYRIELGEIEAALSEHEEVVSCVVLARDEGSRGKALVAYVVPAPEGGRPGAPELRDFLKQSLPPYMVPGHYVFLEALPLNASGKLDRKALPAPEARPRDESAGSALGRLGGSSAADEQILCSILASVLEVPTVGPGDDFFLLGGHSMLATQVVSQVREVFGAEISLRDFFEAPTPEELIERIRAAASQERNVPPLVARHQRPEEIPLSFAQKRLWLIDQVFPGLAAYAMPVVLELEGNLDLEALDRSLQTIVDRHEALRTTFEEGRGEPRQVVHERLRLALPVVELSVLGVVRGRSEALRRARAWARIPFDLERGPLLRPLLLRLAPRHHVLVLTMHHIVSDGWSLGLLVREVAELYPAFSAGRVSPLPELPVQYPDFALWQRSWLRGEVLEQQLAFWREQLRGAPPLLSLQTDRPRPAVQRFVGSSLELSLEPEILAGLGALAQERRATLFMVLLTAFQVLLMRFSGQTDVVVGTPIANRTRREVEDILGFFANTLVLRARADDRPSFLRLLDRVRELALQAQAYQDLPFERLVEELHPSRSLGHTPLFQVMFVLQNAPMPPLDLEGLALRALEPDTGGTHFDLTLRAWEQDEGLRARLEFDTDLFDHTTVARIGEGLRVLLRGVVEDAEAGIFDLPWIRRVERQQVLCEWNQADGRETSAESVLSRFLRQVERQPDHPAVVYGEQEMGYQGLRRRAGALARRLRQAGVAPERPVGLLLERGIDMVVSILAVLEAGGCWLPLDPDSPQERLRLILDQVRDPLVLTQSPDLAASLGIDPERVLRPGRENGEAPESVGPVLLESLAGPQNLAYVVFTSGSTGRPKGAMLTRGGLDAYVGSLGRRLGLSAEEVYLHTASFGFSSSVRQLFLPLCHGATVVVAERDDLADPLRLLALARDRSVTSLDLVPSYWRALVNALETIPEAERRELLDGQLQRLVSASEALPASLPVAWRDELEQTTELLNMFGQTETTGIVTVFPVTPGDSTATVPVGHPIDGMEIYLLDDLGRPVPAQVPGVILIGGDDLGRGYWGDPATTAESFIPHPQAQSPGERLFRPGDLGYRRGDGTLCFLGRRDQQIKIRGIRLELGEVEEALLVHPDVLRVSVFAVGEPTDAQLVAAYVPRTGTESSAIQLRAFLAPRLSDAMIPGVFWRVEALPETATGKIDRRALVAAYDRWEGPEEGASEPRTSTQALLLGLFREVLRREQIGIHDDFFALGGHSLAASRLVVRIREAMEVVPPVRQLFLQPTVAGLAEWIDEARREATGRTELPIEPLPRDRGLPLSFAQERLWLVSEIDPSSAAYSVPAAVHLRGALDVVALEAAFDDLVARHEVLRSTFDDRDGQPVQRVAASGHLPIRRIDLESLTVTARDHVIEDLLHREARCPFDLRRGPLARVLLLRCSPKEHILSLNLHHIISDGWSVGIWVRDLGAFYRARRTATRSGLRPLAIGYADFAVWQRQRLEGENLERLLEFWRRRIQPDDLELPADRAQSADPSGRGGLVSSWLSTDLTAAVESRARKSGATVFMVLMAAFQALLSRLAGQPRFNVGTPIAGRGRREVEDLIGCFVNTLVLPADVSDEPTFEAYLLRVRKLTLEAFDHQDLPFERLVEALKLRRRLDRAPVFQAMFVLQNAPGEALESGDLQIERREQSSGTAKFDLTLAAREIAGRTLLSAEYSSDLFDATTVARWLQHFSRFLEGAMERPDLPLSAVSLLSPAERHQLAIEVSDTRSGLPERPLDVWLDRQIEARGDAVAIESGDLFLSYEELGRRASLLADHLRAEGLGPEERVGIFLERSPEMIVALVAVLKAGGAYLPLDPTYPPERLQFMLEDGQAVRVVTDSELRSRLPAGAPPIVEVEAQAAGVAEIEAPIPVDARSLAYLMYTSGSTGRPKGSGVPHRAVARLVLGRPCLDLGPEETLFFFSSPSFDATTLEVWGPLLTGGRLVIPTGTETELRELGPTLEKRRITTLWLTAALLNVMADDDLGRLGGLRQLLAGGESLSPEHVARVLEAWPRLRFLNGYGPTENTTFSTTHPVDLEEARARKIPIGRPIGDSTISVRDRWGRVCPIGVEGELWVGGVGLSRGYLGRPSLTATSFRPQLGGARWYRTGDRARALTDGTVECLGRIDRQLKIRGFRVEPGEIETAIRQYPGVRDASVGVRGEETRRLLAWVLVDAGVELDEAELRAHLAAGLPAFMVPSALVLVDAFPLTPNGKVDRAALPDPAVVPDGGHRPPSTPMEESLAAMVTELLGVPEVGVDADFFELGGHSLLAARFAARIEETHGLRLPLRTFFEVPTIAELAARLDLLMWAAAEDPEAEDSDPSVEEIDLDDIEI